MILGATDCYIHFPLRNWKSFAIYFGDSESVSIEQIDVTSTDSYRPILHSPNDRSLWRRDHSNWPLMRPAATDGWSATVCTTLTTNWIHLGWIEWREDCHLRNRYRHMALIVSGKIPYPLRRTVSKVELPCIKGTLICRYSALEPALDNSHGSAMNKGQRIGGLTACFPAYACFVTEKSVREQLDQRRYMVSE